MAKKHILNLVEMEAVIECNKDLLKFFAKELRRKNIKSHYAKEVEKNMLFHQKRVEYWTEESKKLSDKLLKEIK